MSLKSIEMQIALPRTQDFGKVQEQHNQRPMITQHQDLVEHKNQAELKRKKSEKLNRPENAMITADDSSSGKQQHSFQHREKQQEKEKTSYSPHPYKGKHIDLSL